MATTDARSGFRLPWSSDRSTETEETAETTPDTAAATATEDRSGTDGAVATELTDVAAAPPDPERDRAGESQAVADPAQPAAEPEAPVAPPAPAPAASPVAAAAAPRVEPRKPNKFLADLTKAMQAAAEEARSHSMAQLQTDAKTHIESIHARSATEAATLRRQADDDVASVREWSKAEIARIREETELKITDRKAQLEVQIDQHAAVIEREIDSVQRTIAAFEEDMVAFFERLLGENDPTRFATMAENLPEPPTFAELTGSAAAEPEVEAAAEAAPAEAPAVAETTDAAEMTAPELTEPVVDEPLATEEPVEAVADTTAVLETATESEPADGVASFVTEPTEGDASSTDREAAFEAIQAAAEAAATEDESDAPVAADVPDDTAAGAGEAAAATVDPADPRFAALGLSPDYDAAEAEALAAANGSDGEEIPIIADDALAARLAGLVPSPDEAETATTAATQVVVVGLVSVASIASFKRHLGRVPGVHSVGVSSGPDGEFVFAVTHSPETNLRDVVPSLPTFQARVTSATDGTVNVTAHDPESDS